MGKDAYVKGFAVKWFIGCFCSLIFPTTIPYILLQRKEITLTTKTLLIYLAFFFGLYAAAVTTSRAEVPISLDRGKELVSTQCFVCHGIDGISLIDMYPNLKGQKEKYLVKQLTAFRDGTRIDPIMGPMASILTDEDITAVSKYLSELE